MFDTVPDTSLLRLPSVDSPRQMALLPEISPRRRVDIAVYTRKAFVVDLVWSSYDSKSLCFYKILACKRLNWYVNLVGDLVGRSTHRERKCHTSYFYLECSRE